MRLGDLLVARRLVTIPDIDKALERQRAQGGRLGENLVALGLLTAEQLAAVADTAPRAPTTIEETGVASRSLMELALKFMVLEACETVPEIVERIRLSPRIVQDLLDAAAAEKYLETRGTIAGAVTYANRYALTERGRAFARDAEEQCHYLGPAPVPLAVYQAQLGKQRITNEKLDEEAMRQGFAGLVVPDFYFRRLLPAINAGRTVMLYGPPGNGKTTLATRISRLFRDVVFIPYAIEVGGQIIRVFDRTLHKFALNEEDAQAMSTRMSVHREVLDERWAACGRPVVMAGGEMTLEMLDLQYSQNAKYYDAPLHVKALNGMLLIDDFGRQKFSPTELLNRWIVPMESQVDYFKLHTGATFSLPFDELLMFSTNLRPEDLVDDAFQRRIPYKIRLHSPTPEEFRLIFAGVSKARGIEVPSAVLDFIVDTLHRNELDLAYYQPNFICNQALETCHCFDLPLVLTRELATEALMNLYFDIKELPDDATGGTFAS
jgi:predicted ATPase with chaperone activity